MKVSPLGVLIAIVLIGVSIEAVEQESKQAAYALVFVLLLGMITFNARMFSQQISLLIGLFNVPAVRYQHHGGTGQPPAPNPTATATPIR